MWKRSLLALLLTTTSLCAAPDPLWREARQLSRQIWERAPGVPARVETVRARLPNLPPGPARAEALYLSGLYARALGDHTAWRKFYEQALKQPGVPAADRAWLLGTIYRAEYDSPPHQEAALKQLVELQRLSPSPEVQFWLLDAQMRAALDRGEQDLADTLAEVRMTLAGAQGWKREQVEACIDAYSWSWSHPTAWWDQGLATAVALPPSPEREDLLLQLLVRAPDSPRRARVLRSLKNPKDPRVRFQMAQTLDRPQQLIPLRQLITEARARGAVDDEIKFRVALAVDYEQLGRLGDALRELDGALQLRLDHPTDWAPRSLQPGSIALEKAFRLSEAGRHHQALALLERALNEGWTADGEQNQQVEERCVDEARVLGDLAALEKHWQAAVDGISQVPATNRHYVLKRLADKAPPAHAGQRSELQRLARESAETLLRTNPSGIERHSVQQFLSRLLRDLGDEPGERAFWRSELERARSNHDQLGLREATMQLMRLQTDPNNAEQMAALKQLARTIVDDPATSASDKTYALSFASVLARAGDPTALAWADESVRLAPRSVRAAGLVLRAEVLEAFRRFPEAFASLDEALRANPNIYVREQIETVRNRILVSAGRAEEAIWAWRGLVRQWLASETPDRALLSLSEISKVAPDWEDDYEQAITALENLGEAGKDARTTLLYRWLNKLANDQRWEDGRKLLSRHPWNASPLHPQTGLLQKWTQWADLLPQASTSTPSPERELSLINVLDQLRLDQPELGQLLTLRSTNLKALQSHLNANDTLVTYCNSGPNLFLLALTKEGGFWRRSSVSSHQLDELVRAYLKEVQSGQSGPAESSLHALLLAPVLKSEPDQRIFLVPTGSLWQLPFAALRDQQGRSAASQASLVMLTSGDLLRLADNAWEPYRLSEPVAIGAPTGADLPGAAQELEDVARLLPSCKLLRGSSATLKELQKPQEHWGLLHVATHAHYRADRPLESEIELQDGTLKLRHLSQVPLAERALVSLSCCQGGASARQSLDEPVTLATGFSAAGAQTVIANLWSVDDEVARVFFTSFYHELALGATPLSAFRQAQQRVRQQYPRERDWAGFFLLGNPG